MAEKIRMLIQRRTSLKSQITNLSNTLDKGRLDETALKLRMKRVNELYNAFEEYNDELAILDPNEAHQTEFINIQERFYSVASRVENIVNPASTSDAGSDRQDVVSRNCNLEIRKRRIKLPEAALPTFDGKYEGWLSFKNAFHNMIGSQDDLSDVDKLQYLKAALIGEAANKVRIFEIDGINYSNAWDVLEKSYEVKRVLISRHLSLIVNTPVLEKETASGLTKIADDMQQHVAALSTLGVSVGPEMVIHIIESKLPRITLEKWEATLERDEFPQLDQIYEFLYKTAVCASKRERAKSTETEKSKFEPPAKRKRIFSNNQTFVLNAVRNCTVCKVKKHPLYMCEKFKQLPVHKRIEVVKDSKLCYNCLRSHRDTPCKFSACRICQKRHNTLIHQDNYATTSKSNVKKTEAAQTE